jgi:hypothetical protein
MSIDLVRKQALHTELYLQQIENLEWQVPIPWQPFPGSGRGRAFVSRKITYLTAGSVSLWSHASSLSLGGGTITPQQNLPPPLQPEYSVKNGTIAILFFHAHICLLPSRLR